MYHILQISSVLSLYLDHTCTYHFFLDVQKGFTMHGKFKISKIINFRNSNLKTDKTPTKHTHFLSLNGQLSLIRAFIICLI